MKQMMFVLLFLPLLFLTGCTVKLEHVSEPMRYQFIDDTGSPASVFDRQTGAFYMLDVKNKQWMTMKPNQPTITKPSPVVKIELSENPNDVYSIGGQTSK